MKRQAVALPFLVVLSLSVTASAAAQSGVPPTMSNPTASRSGTVAATVTLPDGALYSQKAVSGRLVLCRFKQRFLGVGTHRVACRIRSALLGKLRNRGRTSSVRLNGSGPIIQIIGVAKVPRGDGVYRTEFLSQPVVLPMRGLIQSAPALVPLAALAAGAGGG